MMIEHGPLVRFGNKLQATALGRDILKRDPDGQLPIFKIGVAEGFVLMPGSCRAYARLFQDCQVEEATSLITEQLLGKLQGVVKALGL